MNVHHKQDGINLERIIHENDKLSEPKKLLDWGIHFPLNMRIMSIV